MSNSVYAFIYNPYSKTESVYIETDKAEAELSMVSFNKTESYYLKRASVDLKSLLMNSSIEKSNECATTRQEYVDWVEKIQDLIATKEIKKIIAAQKEVSEKGIDLVQIPDLLQRLINNLPDTFIYFYYIKNQAWIGASPELIGRTSKGQFTTISLAGTTNTALPNFTAKEKEEQGIVSSFMEDVLIKYNGTVHRNKTQALAFGTLSHLVDEYSTQIADPNDFANLIEQIHPSPALGGFPKESSLAQIASLEPIQREWYCGHSILVEDEEQYAYAHIRCAKLSENQTIYYAGAGITRDSDAEMEYMETKNKINILKKIIEK